MKQPTFQVISPVDGTVYTERTYANDAAIERALDRASRAWQAWRQVPLPERADICRKAVGYLLEHSTEIAEELSWQMGRPIRYAPLEINKGFRERAHFMIDVAAQALAHLTVEQSAAFQRFIRREALGTVLVFAPLTT